MMKKYRTALVSALIAVSASLGLYSEPTLANELKLNGLAVHQELRKDYFIAGLYLPSTSSKAEDILKMKGAKRMEMRITLNRLSPRKFAGLWRESIVVNNSPEDIEKFGQDMIRFATALKGKLVTGDRVQIDYRPRDATVLIVNDSEMARFQADFFPLLLRTWIGPRPNATDFKKDLLKGGKVSEQLLSRYDSIQPLDGRKQLAAAWASGTAVASVDAGAKARAEAEAKARAEAEAQRKAEEEAAKVAAQKRAEAAAKARAEAEAKRKAEEQARALAKAKAEEEAKARAEAEAAAKAAEEARKLAMKADADTKAKAAAEAKAKAAAEAKARAEAQAKAKAEAEARALAAAKAEEEAKKRAAVEARARAEAEAKAKAEAEARAVAQAKAEEEAKKAAEAAALAAQSAGDGSEDEEDGAVELSAEQISSELYKSKLVAWVYKYLEYPEKDKRRRNEGSIRAVVKITRDGKWISTDLIEKSRYASLDFAAKRAIQIAQPYPSIPEDISGEEFEFTVPILFRSER